MNPELSDVELLVLNSIKTHASEKTFVAGCGDKWREVDLDKAVPKGMKLKVYDQALASLERKKLFQNTEEGFGIVRFRNANTLGMSQ